MKQTIVITGTTRGLGLALCEQYLERGNIVIACVRGQTGGGLERLGANFPGALHVVSGIDMEQDEIEKILPGAVRAVTDRIDMLINNAAILLDNKTDLEALDMDAALKTINVNALGALRAVRCLLPLLKDGGKIVNISSEAGSNATNFRSDTFAYCMSKAALNRASVILQKKLEPRGIRVIVVQPGWMQTDMGGPGAIYPPAFAAEKIANVIADTDAFAHVDLLGNLCEW